MLHAAGHLPYQNTIGTVPGHRLVILADRARDGFVDHAGLVEAQAQLAAVIGAPAVDVGVGVSGRRLVLLPKPPLLAPRPRCSLARPLALHVRNLTPLSYICPLAHLRLLRHALPADMTAIRDWVLGDVEG